ncbi:NAD(P)H nitroreductase [Nocardioides dongkuii]|uniref:NAD(P)H nitroreductase n=1 Tax=Nocardioides dongkuii TaxID=2760089 RepID=UPI0015FB189A|nr:NAD(P)H nitroreductase [Nocardioides dongkuii]
MPSRSMASSAPAPADVHALLGLACRAPSVHNSQPWGWRAAGDTIELYADQSRLFTASDPDGRNLLISCGAALHHLTLAAAAHGWSTTVDRLPDPGRPDLLARTRLVPSTPSPTGARDLAAIAARVTDRRRFTSWPVAAGLLEDLAASASGAGVVVVPVVDLPGRHRTELLCARARDAQAADPGLREEQRLWVDRGSDDDLLAGSDGVLVLGTDHDAPEDRLRAGEALSALWLRATDEQLSVVPVSQVVEVRETRDALRHEVLDGSLHPQLVVRLAWQEIARSTLPRTLRRPVRDVLASWGPTRIR